MLQKEAIQELKELCLVHHDRRLSDAEAHKIGERILTFLRATESHEEEGQINLSTEEQKALDFIKTCIESGNPPSVRAIAAAIGCSSSRSGLRIVEKLMLKRLVSRDGRGHLRILP